MKAVKEWAGIICLAAVACSMLEIIAPNGKMEKIMRFVLGAFMLCAILVPLAGIALEVSTNLNFSNEFKYTDSFFQKNINKQTRDIAEVNIKSLVCETLKEIGVKPEKINVFMDTSEDNSISIIKIQVRLSAKNLDRHNEVKRLLEEKLGLETEVVK